MTTYHVNPFIVRNPHTNPDYKMYIAGLFDNKAYKERFPEYSFDLNDYGPDTEENYLIGICDKLLNEYCPIYKERKTNPVLEHKCAEMTYSWDGEENGKEYHYCFEIKREYH